jgi:uncharacterized protein DUF6894
VRYYFDVCIGATLIEDEQGLDFESEQQAREEARRAISEIASEAIAGPTPPGNVDLWLRNTAGRSLAHHSVTYGLTTQT